MLVSNIYRGIFCKELGYVLSYMVNDKEVSISAHRYALIPLQTRLDIYKNGNSEKYGSVFMNFCEEIDYGQSFGTEYRYGAEQ
jgi:hypothetical protein